VSGPAEEIAIAPIARAGSTCWRIERAERVACLVDAEAYFSAVSSAIAQAKHTILLVGWDFDPRTDLRPQAGSSTPNMELGTVLRELAESRADLHIHILVWDTVLPISATRHGYPQRAQEWFGGNVHFQLDSEHPPGACHHQKLLVIDDAIAFCGGSDFATDRWDTIDHLDSDPRRRLPSGRPHPPRHDVMMMVAGDAARALGELARIRWHRATGRSIKPVRDNNTPDLWPAEIPADIERVHVAIARTEPEWGGHAAVVESLAMHLAAIEAARHTIYLENQYLASPDIEAALLKRLVEPQGPEIVIICPSQSPSYFDRLAIDEAQQTLLARLADGARYGRFRAYTPETAGGHPIIVHSKVSVIDDRLLRIGSTNLNNRSLGFDTECDLTIDAALEAPARRASACEAIGRFRNRLLAHHLGIDSQELQAAIDRHERVIPAIDSIAGGALRPAQLASPDRRQTLRSLIAEYHLGDPRSVSDSWRPWRRKSNAPG
jgi:phosphatidylserine/phosphatidylglycerophosphate/cardiolipin synthase-like enzyme